MGQGAAMHGPPGWLLRRLWCGVSNPGFVSLGGRLPGHAGQKPAGGASVKAPGVASATSLNSLPICAGSIKRSSAPPMSRA